MKYLQSLKVYILKQDINQTYETNTTKVIIELSPAFLNVAKYYKKKEIWSVLKLRQSEENDLSFWTYFLMKGK